MNESRRNKEVNDTIGIIFHKSLFKFHQRHSSSPNTNRVKYAKHQQRLLAVRNSATDHSTDREKRTRRSNIPHHHHHHYNNNNNNNGERQAFNRIMYTHIYINWYKKRDWKHLRFTRHESVLLIKEVTKKQIEWRSLDWLGRFDQTIRLGLAYWNTRLWRGMAEWSIPTNSNSSSQTFTSRTADQCSAGRSHWNCCNALPLLLLRPLSTQVVVASSIRSYSVF